MSPPLPTATDLRGAARLATEGVASLSRVVEAMHARIARLPRPTATAVAGSADRARGLTGLVYRAVRGVTHLAGGGVDLMLAAAERAGPAADPQVPRRPEREALVAALNGVLGDHLAASRNPLAIEMAFRREGRTLPLEAAALRDALGPDAASPRVVVLLHGLCMNDLQWRRSGHDHGTALARDLGWTPVYLHYDSGLAVSANGRLLARQLERLHAAWPVPIERLALLGHSMGGLVARSALHHAGRGRSGGPRWPVRVTDLVCLGSPHHGAPLERLGAGVDLLLGAAPYAAPLARIGRVRSAGIRDLRSGRIAHAPPGRATPGRALHVPLPEGVRCFAVAATLGPRADTLTSRLLGDGLVPVASALGEHADPDRCLAFEASHRLVVPATGHLDLLASGAVYDRLRRWLA